MNQMRRKTALLCKGLLRSPDSEDVDTRGTESNNEDTNTMWRNIWLVMSEVGGLIGGVVAFAAL